MDTYPNIGLLDSEFQKIDRKYWHYTSNQRAFFDEFARANNFDPLQPDNWYPVTVNEVLQHPVSYIFNILWSANLFAEWK